MRIFFSAVLVLVALTPAAGKPTPGSADAAQRCWNANSGALLSNMREGTRLRRALEQELEQPNPAWKRIRPLLVQLQSNGVRFREESGRVEMTCLDTLSPPDRLVFLKREYGKRLPPQILKVEPTH
jgi:hypothetical protein